MGSGKIIIGTERKPQDQSPRLEEAWGLLVPLGVLFAVAGFMDLTLALFPPQVSSAEWRFSAASVAVSGWPLVLVGSTVLAVAASLRNRAALSWGALGLNAVCLAVMFLSVVSLLAGWDDAAKGVPEALKAGLNKGVVKVSVSASLYFFCHLLAVRSTFRGTRGYQVTSPGA